MVDFFFFCFKKNKQSIYSYTIDITKTNLMAKKTIILIEYIIRHVLINI